MTRTRIGSIIEIQTKLGLSYGQYTHQHPMMGGLIRVFDEVFQIRPCNLNKLVSGPVRFSTFFPVRAAIHRGIFKVIGHAEVAPHNSLFPLFRNGTPDKETKTVDCWWLWDGEKSWRVGKLTKEQRNLPLRSVWNDTMLIKRIEEGWTPAKDPW